MSESTTASRRPGSAPARYGRRRHIYDVVVLALSLAAVVPVARLLEPPSFVDRITVTNPTVYDIGIDVTDNDDELWMAVGTARRVATSTFERVIDQGEVWIFRFSAQGRDGGSLRVSRQQLEGDGWRLAIPEEVGRTLAERGAPPSP